MKRKLSAVLLGILLTFTVLPQAFAVAPSQSNPSVVQGSKALLNGPYISQVTYPFFTSDHSSVDALLAGQGEIMDYPPDYPDLQTALSTEYVNVTTAFGANFEALIFNMYSPADPGYYLPFRQAIAQLVNYTYLQSTVLNGLAGGLVSQNPYIPQAFGNYSTNDIYSYGTSLAGATASLKHDPAIAWNPTAHPSNGAASSAFACSSSQVGVWQWATSTGSGIPNGTDFTPIFVTRPDHATWYTESQQIWNYAAQIGLCIQLKPVTGFGTGAYPIVYAAYSNNWAMYFGGSSYGSPLNPVSAEYFTYGQAGIVLGPLDDTSYFYNSTIQPLLNKMFFTGNSTLAELDSQKVVQMLTYQIPSLIMWWDAWSIPTLNSHSGTYWSGYVNVPGFGTWSFGTGYYTLLNVHTVNKITGEPETGGTVTVNLHEAPDDYNLMFAESVYDFDVINSIYFDTPMAAPPGSPTLGSMIPWMLTSPPVTVRGVNMTTPHGYKMVDGQTISLNFMKNITFQDNVPFTANDYNFSLWYLNLNGVYGPYVNNTPTDYAGLLPTLLDSKVTGKYSMTIYINSTSSSDWLTALTAPALPEHLWTHVSSTELNGDVDPTSPSNDVNGQLLMTGVGAFYWAKYVTSQYVTLDRFPGYFRTNIHAWQLPQVAPGSTEPLSFAVTQTGTPIPASAVATATATLNGGSAKTVSLSYSSTANGNWTGSFDTTGWTPGFYEVTVNATYTDSFGQAHTALEFYGMTVGTVVTTTTSSTSTTTTTSANYTAYYVAAIVVVIVIVVGAVAYSRRSRPR
jgi:hypothetical protein